MSEHLTWEPDIETEEIDGVSLAAINFTTGCGMVRVDHFTPDALRALAQMLHEHAHTMDGREPNGVADLKQLLAEVYPHIGGYPYEVPDGLKAEVELAADINRHEAFGDFDDDDDDEATDDFANPPATQKV